jgi:hypothetical protein
MHSCTSPSGRVKTSIAAGRTFIPAGRPHLSLNHPCPFGVCTGVVCPAYGPRARGRARSPSASIAAARRPPPEGRRLSTYRSLVPGPTVSGTPAGRRSCTDVVLEPCCHSYRQPAIPVQCTNKPPSSRPITHHYINIEFLASCATTQDCVCDRRRHRCLP